MRRRALCAMLLVALLLAAVAASGAAQRTFRDDGVAAALLQDLADSAGSPADQVQKLVQGEGAAGEADADESRAGAAASAEELKVQAPLFAGEGFVPDDAFDVRVGGQGRVIGLNLPGTAAQAFSQMRQGLEEAGWTAVPSGQDACGSFVKETGLLRWLMVSCYQAKSQANVVVQCAVDVRKEN